MENQKNIPIRELLPQQPPFLMIDALLHCDETNTSTSLTVREDNIFCEGGVLREPGMIENIAQTCAARIGYLNRLHSEEVRIGVIGAVKDLRIYDCPTVESLIRTDIEVLNEVMGVTLVKAVMTANGETIAECEMKIAISGDNNGN
jgi:predicted hotdog family 3-hydroxylacyl-ACP dehydratase